MNIKQFKEGDLITRSEAAHGGDRSYMGDEIEYVGIENGMIALVSKDFCDEFRALKLRTDWWSEGWDYFPKTLWQKAVSRAKEKAKNILKLDQS